ncbi:hypothetical protein BC833DRAFT_594931 [Globomyces pollinis-pini]|nr:hypothetical protein BC833DRAFT_594931 [Globomyces pollinis-pini]
MLQQALFFYNFSSVIVFSTGILSFLVSLFLFRQFFIKTNFYKFHLALLVLFNGFNMCFRYLRLTGDNNAVYVIGNWLQVSTILLLEWVQYDLLKLVCIASTFLTVRKVELFRLILMILTLIGLSGLLFIKLTFQLGDGSIMDKWNRFGSIITTAFVQLFSLCQGVYMTFLMKSLCLMKDKSRSDYQKHVKKSYWLLGYFVTSNVLCALCYIFGIFIRGPEGSANAFNYHSLSNFATVFLSNQILGLVFLFESIKAMKFGSEVDKTKMMSRPKSDR